MDAFVLAKLEEEHLQPAPPADRRTLIRRITYDLIGLPPTPEEVEAFVEDPRADAYAQLVDRRLASPHYGERWGRYWLDVARYADTKGYLAGGEERRYAFSYTYRDYVVRAFNEDKPYDQFLIEQIAADRLPMGDDKSTLSAMGFLTLGRRFLNNQNDIIDDRLDVVTRGTLGLTVTCARCHDHKFDPISQKDYYALHGVLASSEEPAEQPLLRPLRDSPEYQDYLKAKAKIEAEMEDFKEKEIAKFIGELRQNVGDYLLGAHDAKPGEDAAKFDTFAVERKLLPAVLRRWMADLEVRSKKPDPIYTPWFELSKLTEAEFATNAPRSGAGVPPASSGAGVSPALGLPAPDFAANAQPLLAQFATDSTAVNPVVAKALADRAPESLKQVAEAYTRLFRAIDAEWRTNLTTAADEKKPAPTQLPDTDREALRLALYAEGTPANLPKEEVRTIHARRLGEGSAPFRNRIEALSWTLPGAPQKAIALADRANPGNSHVFKRGNPSNPGDEVPRRFLEVLSEPSRPPFTNGSGRLELARAIASRDNPLTARVFVNRVWLHHFGEGLVRTPGDFGVRTEPPLQQDLLDYLSASFMESRDDTSSAGRNPGSAGVSPASFRPETDNAPAGRQRSQVRIAGHGWSMKKLHRLIVLSATYQQSCEASAASLKADPDNRYLSRMNRRRLDFEALRDTLLAVAGKLDPTVGGLPVDLVAEPFTPRRAVYGLIDRQNLPGVFRSFDFANPDVSNQGRFTTTVPQQALFLMNSPFVIEQARRLVQREEVKAAANDAQKLQTLARLVWQRPPDRDELRLGEEFLAAQPPTAAALSPLEKYAQSLLLSNELMFVD